MRPIEVSEFDRLCAMQAQNRPRLVHVVSFPIPARVRIEEVARNIKKRTLQWDQALRFNSLTERFEVHAHVCVVKKQLYL